MAQVWIDTERADEARRRADALWVQARKDIHAEEFWADEIKKYRAGPVRQLS